MDYFRRLYKRKVENIKSSKLFQSGRKCNGARFRYSHHNNKNNNYINYNRIYKYVWTVAFILSPARTFANTTVASPQSQSTGVVNNNATMITPSSHPQFKMSQGIICSSPSLTFTPYVTDAWSFNRPIEQVTRQNIYDENTGEIKYVLSLIHI